MTNQSSPTLLALHGLRLKGFADSGAVASLIGLDENVVTAELRSAAESDLVVHRDGRRTGWSLRPAGRQENERLLAAELDGHGLRDLVRASYERFMELNPTMLAVCTRWQVKDQEAQILNDHADADYDAAVITELGRLDEEVQPICAELGSRLERFTIYGPRFDSALEKVRAGEHDWFTAPMKESYHTVWFELHEDLLATLGIDRASEHAGEGK